MGRKKVDRMQSKKMRRLPRRFLATALLVTTDWAYGFSTPPRLTKSTRQYELRAKKEEDKKFRSSTSFGTSDVPESQRPVNEYLDLIDQPLFGWATEDVGDNGLAIRLAAVYAVTFGAVCYPISGATFTQDGYMLQKLAASNVGALLLIVVLLVRLYSGWGYVGARLQSKVVEFEETGWYDGDIATKTKEETRRDGFLYQDTVKPVIDRLKTFTLATGGLWVASCVALNVAVSNKPRFNEYDPAVLERVRYDERLANVAARESGSRPTYCDSRYYRAVANGGQGCNAPTESR